MTITETTIHNVETRHHVDDPAKVRSLAESMRSDGWQAGSVIVIDTAQGDGGMALNGVHRIAALRELYETGETPRGVEWVEIETEINWTEYRDSDDVAEALRDAGFSSEADIVEAEG